ncbi:MAG: DUF3472 domain-containing protein [Terrimicrobiaceae bacterium]
MKLTRSMPDVLRWLSSALAVAILLAHPQDAAIAADHRHGPTGAYTEWIWPESPASANGKRGYTDFEHRVTPEVDPGSDVGYFWSHQVEIVNGATAYFGLQTLGRRPDGSEGKVAIFSIWDALSARGPGLAQPFDGEGEGYQTLIPFDWKAGRTYRMRMFLSGSSRQGTDWTATVREDPNGREKVIGTITVPKKWHRLGNWSVMWSERYTGPEVLRCNDVGYSRVRFGEPSANRGTVTPEQHRNYITDPANCPNSRVRDVGRGSIQEMGIPK